MGRTILCIATAWLLSLAVPSSAQDTEALPPLAKPGDTYVSLQVHGCAAKCPSFEIYVFGNGRSVFRSNNKHTAAKGRHFKSGMPNIYKTIAKYLEDSNAFSGQSECAQRSEQATVVTVQSAHDGQVQKTSLSTACPEQRDKAKSIAKVFVNQTGMWKLIHSDTRYWEKYWEDPAMTGREDVAQ